MCPLLADDPETMGLTVKDTRREKLPQCAVRKVLHNTARFGAVCSRLAVWDDAVDAKITVPYLGSYST